MAEEPEAFEAFYRNPRHCRPRAGESLASLSERVGQVYDHLVASHPGRHLLIVAHADVMRALVGRVLPATPERWYRVRLDDAGLVRIRHDRFGANLECVDAQRIRYGLLTFRGSRSGFHANDHGASRATPDDEMSPRP
jgi:alpha-ribazole phosphatase